MTNKKRTTLEEAFDYRIDFSPHRKRYDKSIRDGRIVRAFIALKHAGFNFLEELDSVDSVYNVRNLSHKTIAVIVVVCEHYGIKLNKSHSVTRNKFLEEEVKDVRETIIFPK